MSTIINGNENIFAHKKIGNYETLLEHSFKTLSIYKELRADTLSELINKLDLNNEFITYLCDLSVFMHDFGKATPYFQKLKMGIDIPDFVLDDGFSTKHSQLSGDLFFNQGFNFLTNHYTSIDINDVPKYLTILTILTMIVSKHHSKITDIDLFKEEYVNFLTTIKQKNESDYSTYTKYLNQDFLSVTIEEDIKNPRLVSFTNIYDENLDLNSIFDCDYLYLFTNTMFSLLTQADILATKYYFSNYNFELDSYKISDLRKLNSKYKSSNLAILADEYRTNYTTDVENIKNINDLRNNLVLDIDDNLSKLTGEESIYYLESGVGSGKTHLVNRIALYMLNNRMFEVDKVIYALPFNAISDQVYNYVSNIEEDSVKIDSSTKVKYVIENNQINYQKTVINRQMLNYKYSVISFVQLFNILFSNSKSDSLKRLQLRNSLIILDEIQTLDLRLIKTFMNILNKYTKIYKFKVVFMSATLPKISDLINLDGVELNSKYKNYSMNPNFKDRNVLNLTYYMDSSNQIDVLNNEYIPNTRFLVHCITLKQAELIYNSIKDKYENVRLYTSRIPKREREMIVNELKERDSSGYVCKDMILITTSSIEAGVDIDMNKCVTDISVLDSLEQISGRVNRNNLFNRDDSEIFVINHESAGFLDKIKVSTTNRINLNELVNIFSSKNYENYFYTTLLMSRNIDTYYEQLNAINNLQYKKISEYMKLITNTKFSYYLINSELSRTLMNKYKQLTMLMKTDNKNFDKYYLERKDVLINLSDFKKEITDKNEENLFIEYCSNNGIEPTSIVFWER